MPDIDAWIGDSFPLSSWIDPDRSVDMARIISDKSTSIVIVRGDTTLSAQTVRIEEFRGDSSVQSEAGVTSMVDAVVFGYKGHPTLTDTDIQPQDRFSYESNLYEVVAVVPATEFGIQAYARVRS